MLKLPAVKAFNHDVKKIFHEFSVKFTMVFVITHCLIDTSHQGIRTHLGRNRTLSKFDHVIVDYLISAESR